jgi:HlyD family secretion protein
LYSEGVIALSQLEKTEQAYIQTKSSYQNLLASLSSTQMTVNQLKFDIIDLQGQRLDKTGTMVNIMKEAYENLQANISDWEKQYVLASPIAGKVTFTNIWSKNQFVTTNDQVFSVIPVKPQEIIGRMRFSTTGSGKVETGQQVLIQLENFPFNEFGMLEGTITSISLIPQTTQDGTFYTSQLSLNHGLTTNYGTPLVFNQEMHGQAQIITNRISVFERFISPLKYVFKKSI